MRSTTTNKKNKFYLDENTGHLNRNLSQSQLTNLEQDSREVELKAQSGENSQLLMDSRMYQSMNYNQIQAAARFSDDEQSPNRMTNYG